jgi:uncharacterized protein
MKLQPDRFDVPSVTGYGPGWIAVQGEKIQSSVVISSNGTTFDWHCQDFSQLNASHFEALSKLDVELVIFGSGKQLRFPPATLLQVLMRKRIGLETMDTQAACRTYNILAGEGRKVAAALLIETPTS